MRFNFGSRSNVSHYYYNKGRICYISDLNYLFQVTDGSTKTTTTKFTTSASPHENNVFVVEVQQGGAPRTTDCFADNSELYPKFSSSALSSQEDIDEEDGSRRSSSQRAQVHRPPDIDVDEVSDEDDLEDIDDEEEEDEVTEKVGGDVHGGSTNTGLSQSDLSISSSGSNNPSYRYGNQLGYEGGHFGYPQYVGYSSSEEKFPKTASSSSSSIKAPIIRRYPPAPTVMKRASSVTEATEKPAKANPVRCRYSIDVTPVSERLLSDIQATERRRIQIEDDRIQEEQRQLGNGTVKANKKAPLAVSNGDSTSSSVEEEQPKNGEVRDEAKTEEAGLQRTGSLPSKLKKEANANKDEANDVTPKPETEDEKGTSEANEEKVENEGVSKKRASLPIITPEIYTQIKQTTKSLILDKTPRPGLSPKFEKFRNENSPLDETEKEDAQQVPDSTSAKSQEYENEAFVPSDHVTS